MALGFAREKRGNMNVDKIRVRDDPRIKKCSTFVNGTTYSYLLGLPEDGKYRATIFLIHGFPDISMGWRYQIPVLLKLGLRVVAPDSLGYGGSDAPDWSPESAKRYGLKQCAADVKALAHQLGCSTIILGGHDWGGFAVYRIAQWCPELVTHIFAVCTPYTPPHREYLPIYKIVKERVPSFGYQLTFISGQLERVIRTKDQVKQFLISMYGGRTADGKFGFSVEQGPELEKLPHLKRSWIISEEELDYYAEEFSRKGIHGPLNWYRTREQNWKDELPLLADGREKLTIPILFLQALQDAALKPELAAGMEARIPNLTWEKVDAGHWALWEKPQECNAIITRWIEGVVFAGKNKL